MKIVHTADWHIGKIVNERSMLDDQAYILAQWLEKTKTIRPDVVLMAGDLYDRSMPSREAVNLTNQILTAMVEQLDCPICVIAGNHDSGERVAYASQLLQNQQLFMVGLPTASIQKVTVAAADIYMVPFADYATLRRLFANESIHNFADAAQVQIEQIKMTWDPDRINILMFHGYVTNTDLEEAGMDLEHSDSERPLSIGTVEYVPSALFAGFDYVALGHLHSAQRVGNERVRYSGSPLKYSKSEANQKKQFLEVDLNKQTIEVATHELVPLHDMRTLKGDFQTLMQTDSEDYVFIELTDTVVVHEGMNRLRKNYPNAMNLAYINLEKMGGNSHLTNPTNGCQHKRIEDIQLFADFYRDMLGQEMTAEQNEIVAKIFQEVKED